MGIIYIFLNENDTTIFQLGHPLKFEVRQNAVEMIMAYKFCISPVHASYSIPDTTLNCSL